MKTILCITLAFAFSTLSFAQSVSDVASPSEAAPKSKKEVALKNNTNAVQQLSKHIQDNLRLPESVQSSDVKGKSLVNIHLDKFGVIQSIKIIESLGVEMDLAIQNALSSISQVDPIVINGVARAKTIQLPVSVER